MWGLNSGLGGASRGPGEVPVMLEPQTHGGGAGLAARWCRPVERHQVSDIRRTHEMTMTIASAVAPAVWKVFVALMIAVCFGFRLPDPQLDPAGFGSSSLDRR